LPVSDSFPAVSPSFILPAEKVFGLPLPPLPEGAYKNMTAVKQRLLNKESNRPAGR
jgi:hypothetical protein